jgi:5-methyltetrahydropteroyltriglutamate--homocysteine methyltransferase
MQRSSERFLTTHVGSLPRPPDLLAMILAKEQGAAVDTAAYESRVKKAVAEVVRRQAECGIDILADGEMGRFGFIPYVNERLAGIEPRPNQARTGGWARSREYLAFPEYYAWAGQMPGAAGRAPPTQWVCTGPVSYQGRAALDRDIANLKVALAETGSTEAFMPAVSPANLANWNANEYYKSDEEFRVALADALHDEYRAIVDAGLVLQIDDPQFASHWAMHPEIDLAECRRWAAKSVELLNHALSGIPPDRVRYHTCYSINMGPRVHDIELKNIVDIMLDIDAGAYSFEAANPRHEHEWKVWETAKLPPEKLLVPGIVTHASNLVEHPEAVAQRILRFAGVVGRERVIAGADCGFASMSTSREVHPSVVWAKFAALAEGARIASAEVWGRS